MMPVKPVIVAISESPPDKGDLGGWLCIHTLRKIACKLLPCDQSVFNVSCQSNADVHRTIYTFSGSSTESGMQINGSRLR